jgi:uncharacterized protein YjbI with pentapeptide repeats
MANPEHLAMLKQGAKEWNSWREINSHAVDWNMTGKVPASADLVLADLSHTDLAGANLSDLALSSVNFSGADLSNANLWGADLSGAKLNAANLRRADLTEARLSGTNLEETDLTDVQVGYTSFSNVDLSVARGLETVRHAGPSSIGIDTIYRSRGKIPEIFLRRCGVPDEFIAYIGSMVGRPLEFYSCFISYSTRDQEFADRLYADLQSNGVRCWFAPHDIHGGRKIHEQIDDAIRLHDKLLLILSENSMNSSWVKTEVANAREREEMDNKQMLFPITLASFDDLRKWKLFDADRGIDSAREVREYFIPDFTKWKEHDCYVHAFQRLIADLKAESAKA